jgi:hypothetical protein
MIVGSTVTAEPLHSYLEPEAEKKTSLCPVAAQRYIGWSFSPFTGRFREHDRPFWPHPLPAYIYLAP